MRGCCLKREFYLKFVIEGERGLLGVRSGGSGTTFDCVTTVFQRRSAEAVEQNQLVEL